MKTFFQIWAIPLVMSLLITFGLLAALLATGIWHWLSWVSLIIPVFLMTWHLFKKK